MTRRELLLTSAAAPAAFAAAGPINRHALVARHNPTLARLDPLSPLSVGNGEFAFTADITGLQTFPALYDNAMPLCTQSQWGWHSFPDRPEGDLKLTPYDTHGRQVGYATKPGDQKELFNWLRENPHRLHLGRIGFNLSDPKEIITPTQTLDLWNGRITSKFTVRSSPIEVQTCCHPALDILAVRIIGKSPGIIVEFPYGSGAMNAADWAHPEKHITTLSTPPNRALLHRQLDRDSYDVTIAWQGQATVERKGAHRFELNSPGNEFFFVCHFEAFQKSAQTTPSARQVFDAATAHWTNFWRTGGAIQIPGSPELERRVVLSQYLTAIQCSGSIPPQETGLTCNSWYGKFHLEMHWWHAAHFALWGRAPLLEKSLAWYQRILPVAKEKAKRQGFAGARWPKMVGPDGRDSPSEIGELLIWQQPHPISYAELCYQSRPGKDTLNKYREIVFESAEFMASFACYEGARDRYILGPPVIPAQENHPPNETWNPTFELEQWDHGLRIAQLWRIRLGLRAEPKWDEIRAKLSKLPVKDGVYLAHENCPQTFSERNRDHPSMLGALGVLPGRKVDQEVMRRTLHKTFAEWRWPDAWGWDFPMAAMTAARLKEPQLAIDVLMMNSPKNTWLPNGHNWNRANLPLYLPGNGGLLNAVARMAFTAQFPSQWNVRHEGLVPPL